MTVEQINEFVKYLNKQVDNNSIYVWGGQGELLETLTLAKLSKMEGSKSNVKRVVAMVNSLIQRDKNISMARCFDCSGLGTYKLLEMGLIKSDMTADGLYKKCTKKSLNKIKKGDFVFKVTTEVVKDENGKTITRKKATHIGYVVDNDKNIVEAYGRDLGVIKRKLYEGSHFTEAGTFNG